MYVVLDRETKEIVHINRAPLSQALSEKEVYYHYDPESMLIGRTDARELPPRWKLNNDGEIVPDYPEPSADVAAEQPDGAAMILKELGELRERIDGLEERLSFLEGALE